MTVAALNASLTPQEWAQWRAFYKWRSEMRKLEAAKTRPRRRGRG
jgi:hypothetical protein